MLAAFADSIAALSRKLPLGSPPPWRAATVISRRILENSFPRWTSVLPFFRLICDHRECPDMVPSPSFVDRCFELLDTLEAPRAAIQRSLPTPLLPGGIGLEGRTRARAHVRHQMDEGLVGRTGVAHLSGPRHLSQHLDPDLQGRRSDMVQAGLERHDLAARDRRVEVQRVQARGHDNATTVAHGEDTACLV